MRPAPIAYVCFVAALMWAAILAPFAVRAANCPAYNYILTNGQVADANQVMNNFNTVLACANTLVSPAQLSAYAPLVSPHLTGTPTAPTQTLGDNSTAVATDAFVQAAQAGRGLQSAGQIILSVSTTLGAAQAGHNVLVGGSGTTITFPSSNATYWLNDVGSNAVTLSFPSGSDFRNVLFPNEQIGLTGDGTGFWRTVAAGIPYYGVTASTGDNSLKLATTAFVQVAVGTAVPAPSGGVAGDFLTNNGTTTSWGVAAPPVRVEVTCSPSSCTVNNGTGVSSVTYVTAGTYTVNFTSSFANSNYIVALSSEQPVSYVTAPNTGHIQVNLGSSFTAGLPVAADGNFSLLIYGS